MSWDASCDFFLPLERLENFVISKYGIKTQVRMRVHVIIKKKQMRMRFRVQAVRADDFFEGRHIGFSESAETEPSDTTVRDEEQLWYRIVST